MAEVSPTPMHADFPRWYREADVNENRDRLQLRWNGISAIVPRLDKPSVEGLLRIVFHFKGSLTSEFVGKTRAAFKLADDLFDMQGNDREVELLAGSVLAVLLEGTGQLSPWAALAITTSALNGTRTTQLPIDLVTAAENSIVRFAEKNRARPTLQDTKFDPPKVDFSKAKEKFKAALDVASFNGAFDAAAEATNLALRTMVRKFNSAIDQTANFVSIQDEELEMLWWVLGERSNGVKMPFTAVPVESRPLVFSSELAKATVYLPGPLSVAGLLTRAGLKGDETLSIPDAVNACSRNWLESISDGINPSSLSQPIHFAIQRKLETQDKTSWIPGWAANIGSDANSTYPALDLAKLFYRERLIFIF
jgi:hypothetical protein